MNPHIAIYISNTDNKEQLINSVISGQVAKHLAPLKGVLFSEITLNKLIDEEIHHGHFKVATKTKNSLQKSSEGERKQALLKYLIAQNPEYLIVDNVYGSLDASAQSDIKKTLTQLSAKTPIVQITNRKIDLLPFINNVYQLKGKSLVKYEASSESSINNTKYFIQALPQSNSFINNSSNTLVTFKNVTISYRERVVLNNICWDIKPGEFWQLLGPNGSGKSTMLSMIFGDNPKAYGQDITLFGVKKGSGESVWEIKRKIGYFSSDMVRGFARLDAIGNMIVSGFFDSVGLYNTPTNAQIKIAQQWLRVLNMFDIRKKSFLSLSKGHQRLVLIARAMVKNPPLLILDEPTNGLDDADTVLFTELINKIAAESNTAILYVSHRKEEKLKPDFTYQLLPQKTGSIGKKI